MSFLLIINLLIILSVIFIEQKKPAEAILWVVIMLLLPGLGAILYLILGSTIGIKLTRFFRAKKLEDYTNVPIRKALEQSQDQNFLATVDLSDKDKNAITFNINYNQSPLVFCDDTTVYTSGVTHYEALFEDIKNAKVQILVEFYTIHNDHVGHALVNALAEKAKEGVRVKVLCDFIANIFTPYKMFSPLFDAGGQVQRIKPFLTHYRSHRKIVVIDNVIGYIGGMNIGKQYINESKKKPWRDTQVRVTGLGATMLGYHFIKDWVCAISSKAFYQLEDEFYQQVMTTPSRLKVKTTLPCQFVVGGVDTDKESIKGCYLNLIQNAKERILIQTPYFIPDSSTLDALKVASASGVQVEIMVPGISASFFLTPVTRWYLGQLLSLGAKVHHYQGYIHAKTLVVDNEITCIGSVNMDVRSLLVDDEICGLFYDNSFTSEYIEIFENDVQKCQPYTYKDFQKRSRLDKVKERVYLLFSPLM